MYINILITMTSIVQFKGVVAQNAFKLEFNETLFFPTYSMV